MNRTELWAAYVARNPQFSGDGNVTMSAAGLRKLFDQTWDMAEQHAKAEAKDRADFMERIFGKAGRA